MFLKFQFWSWPFKDFSRIVIHPFLNFSKKFWIQFRKICSLWIKSSEYPVVITLEDHLTPDLQAKTAEASGVFALLLGFRVTAYLLRYIFFLVSNSRWSVRHLEMYCFVLARNAWRNSLPRNHWRRGLLYRPNHLRNTLRPKKPRKMKMVHRK